jgi:5-deoxy-5-amino-3-dehydroquinate synthase
MAAGKNLIGCFWQPSAVLCDTEYLQTLPRRELVNGFGELARCHFIGAPNIHELPVFDQIVTSLTLKASIVAAAEQNPDLRHILNYGHTLGHALELATDFTLRHGEAVAIGTVYAGYLADALGRIDAARQAEHVSVVRGYGLPIGLPADVTAAQLVDLMRMDKKAADGELAFVLDGRNGAEIVRGIPEAAVLSALAAMPGMGPCRSR